LKGYVAAVIRDRGRFLMVFHKGINKWVFPGGKPEEGEQFKDALIRELGEELDITVATHDVRYRGAAAHKVKGDDWVGVFFTVRDWRGVPRIMEPEQHGGCMWMSLDDMQRTYDVPYVEVTLAEAISEEV
jgi:8-oxo-dGTP pyrophosphatase MutT (NUDIX family)